MSDEIDLDAIEARVDSAYRWIATHPDTHSGRKGDVRAYIKDAPALIAEIRRLRQEIR